MGEAARAAAAERNPDGRAHRCALEYVGFRFGAAVTVSAAALAVKYQCDPPSAAMISLRRSRYKSSAAL
jgi:hypothetical protein